MAGTRVLHRSIRQSYPVAAGGKGIHIYDTAGKAYIDASGGAAVSCLGHGHPDVLAAMRAQLDKLAYAHTSFFTSEVAEELGEDLVAHAPPGIGHAYFVSGGSEAVEAALKMARQYFVEMGEPQRRHFIARRQSYHGNTLGALAVGGNAWRRQQFAPLLIEAHHVSPCYEYRGRQPDETARQYGESLVRELESKIHELGPETVIAFIAETVVGATVGAIPPVEGYFKGIRDLCDRHGILLILDEVMCGMGRTGTLHACEQEGIAPDLLAVAKGLGGGYAPIGSVLVGAKVFDAFDRGSGLFQHGHTYMGHPLACAAALAVQRVIRRDGLLDNVRRQGEHLARRLAERFGNHARRARPRPVPGHRAGAGPPHQGALRSGAQAPCPHQAGSHGARPDGLSHGRDHRWNPRRPRATGAAVHRGRGRPRHHRRPARRRGGRGCCICGLSVLPRRRRG